MVFKIKDPDPGPIEPAQEFVPYVVPKTVDEHIAEVSPVWSLSLPEVDDVNEWLGERLKERWPHMNDWGLKQWLIQAMGDRGTLLIRTPATVGMFFADKNLLEPYPRVREVFVRGKEGKRTGPDSPDKTPEYVALYKRAMEWAQSIKAVDFEFGLDTDAPISRVQGLVASLRTPVKKVTTYSATFED